MVNDKIFVSVLMSVYSEKPSILEECINSILKQTFSNFEFLIYLDKPDNEELWSFLVEKASQDSRIIIHKNETKQQFISFQLSKSSARHHTRLPSPFAAGSPCP